MNLHPSNLWAASHCWSLRRAWAALRDVNTTDSSDGLRSTTYGTRNSSGGHSDPTPATADTTTRSDRIAELVREHVDSAKWLATSARRQHGMPIGPALAMLTAVIGDLDPATAHEVGRHLHRADTAIRRTLRLDTDHWPIPGNPPCPNCRTRMLRARRSNPDSSTWPVICAAECRCTGNTCGCGMPVRVRGVEHIWSAAWARTTLNLTGTDMETTTA